MKNISFILSLLAPLILCCTPAAAQKATTFARGADISWITQTEAAGRYKFCNDKGEVTDGYALLKECGINAIRLRVWVHPMADHWSGRAWCDTRDVVEKAVRAKQAGMEVMIDFHYSDWWADPQKQNPPLAWQQCGIDALCDSVEAHTTAVLKALKRAGVKPRWVQVGNETPEGFMLPTGDAIEHPQNFARLFATGYKACKKVFPKVKVLVHIDSGEKLARTEFILNILQQYRVPYDMVGWSLYPGMNWTTHSVEPNWHKKVDACIENIDSIYKHYHKEVMLVEVGMPDGDEKACCDAISWIIEKSGGLCRGLFYWEPLTTPDMGYGMGALKPYSRTLLQPNEGLKAFRTPR